MVGTARKRTALWKLVGRLVLLVGGLGGGISLIVTAVQSVSANRAVKAERALSIAVHENDYFLNAYKYKIGPACDDLTAILLDRGLLVSLIDNQFNANPPPVIDTINKLYESDADFRNIFTPCAMVKTEADQSTDVHDPMKLVDVRKGIKASLFFQETKLWMWEQNAVPIDYMCDWYGNSLDEPEDTKKKGIIYLMSHAKSESDRKYFMTNYPGTMWAGRTGGLCKTHFQYWYRYIF